MDGISAGDFDFSGQTVLVTGAGGGIGSATARAFYAHGAKVALVERSLDALTELAAELGDAPCFGCDQSRVKSVGDLVKSVTEGLGSVDVLINNAGMLMVGEVLDAEPADIEAVISTNLLGPILIARGIAAGMVARGRGVIVSTASQLAFSGAATRTVYATTKAGMVQFTKGLGAELAPLGVRVVAIAPGRTDSPMTAPFLRDPVVRRDGLAHIPAGRYAAAREMARMMVLLASPICDYVVGETVVVDGGFVLV